MNFRRFKKYIKQILACYEYDDLFEKQFKKYCVKQAKRFKNKRQLKNHIESE